MKTKLLNVIVVSAIAIMVLSPAAWGGCEQMYPDSDVTVELSDAKFQNCTFNKMVPYYNDLLKEKYGLLTSLRSAYSRKLNEDVVNNVLSNDARNDRLVLYDKMLSNLLSVREFLATWIVNTSTDVNTLSGNEVSYELKEQLKLQLKFCKETTQALKRKIKQAKEVSVSSETNDFCKLDYKFRISEGANSKINDCLK